ncbi:MAG: DNA primase small subunit domain-containing protein, partial [Myxococcota bacterium]
MAKRTERYLEVAEQSVRISSPDKPWFPDAGLTKWDVVQYWLQVAEGAVRGVCGRPMALERFVKGMAEPPFYQKRVPKNRPDYVETVVLKYPSGRSAEEIVVQNLAQLLYVVNLGCFSLHPHAVRKDDLHHPDELRIDLDPVPGVPWSQVRDVALVVREVLHEHELVGWPKTSGKRGLHIWVRIAPQWTFDEVRKAALAVAVEVARRTPDLATAAWWKEERHGVFVDYNQNAKDHTMAAAWSVRPTPQAQVSMPLSWDAVPDSDPTAYTVRTAPGLIADHGDPHAAIDDAVGDLTSLLALREDQERDAPDDDPNRPAPTAGRRTSTKPLIIIGESDDEAAAMAGLERFKSAHPKVVEHLAPHHVL